MRLRVRPMKYLPCFILLLLSVTVMAQAIECPTLEKAALAETGLWCTAVEQGQLCYGNSSVQVQFRSATSDFNAPGNRVLLADISSIQTSTAENLWGAAFAEVAAYPGDSWTPAPAAMIIMGNTTVTDAGTESTAPNVITLEITDVSGANVRAGPFTDAGIVGSVHKGDLVKVTGRLTDGSWVRIQTPKGVSGWVSNMTITADVSGVPVAKRDEPPPEMFLRPFAAFNLESGMNDARCAGAPESGVLVQSPDLTPYRFRVNGVLIELAGTMFLQAQPDTFFMIYVLEGEADASIGSARVTIEQGFQSVVMMTQGENGTPLASGAPGKPSAYDHTRLLPLPTHLLPRPAYVVFDLRKLIKARPTDGSSPLAGVLVTDPCVITVGADDVNLRSGAGTDFPIRAVINTRESALPVGRAVGTDGNNWWQLSQDVWISGTVTITGGNCAAVPIVEAPLLPPPATPTP